MAETDKTELNLLMRQLRAGHAALRTLLDEVRSQLAACNLKTGSAKGQCVADAMRRLVQHIERHFAHEEQGGWLEEAVVRAPHLAHRLTLLEQQHIPLRKQAAELLALTATLVETPDTSIPFHEKFDCFTAQLLQHEADEEHVLAEGFNEDLDP